MIDRSSYLFRHIQLVPVWLSRPCIAELYEHTSLRVTTETQPILALRQILLYTLKCTAKLQ